MLAKILLAILLVLLASRFGLRTKLRHLRPKFERAINLMIIGLGLIYGGQMLWWLFEPK